MTRVLALLLGAATVVAALDLAHKAHAISERDGAVLLHDRPARYVIAGAALSLAWAGAVALTRSSSIAFAGGVVLGGAAGNLVSFALWPRCQASLIRSSRAAWRSALGTSRSSVSRCWSRPCSSSGLGKRVLHRLRPRAKLEWRMRGARESG